MPEADRSSALADPTGYREDLQSAIDSGNYPQWINELPPGGFDAIAPSPQGDSLPEETGLFSILPISLPGDGTPTVTDIVVTTTTDAPEDTGESTATTEAPEDEDAGTTTPGPTTTGEPEESEAPEESAEPTSSAGADRSGLGASVGVGGGLAAFLFAVGARVFFFV